MDHQNQSSLRFSLEESIWFAEGQGVAELYSLSIDPDVTVTEQNQYVVIEGTLQVSGEYRGVESELISTEDQTDSHDGQEQYVHQVEQRQEDGIYMFFHEFPVNISIPTNRVMDREVVEIDISSFDYQMPETRCIKLFAELLITGIYEENREQDVTSNDTDIEQFINYEEKSEMEQMSVSLQAQEYESFTAEAFALPREGIEKLPEDEEVPVQFNANTTPFNPMHSNFSFPLPTFQRTDEDVTFGNVPSFEKEELLPPFKQEESAPIYDEPVSEEWMENPNTVEARSSDEGTQSELPIQDSLEEKAEEEAVERKLEDLPEQIVVELQEDLLEEDYQEESAELAPTVTYLNEQNRQVHKPKEGPTEKKREPARASVHLTDFFAKKETNARTSLKVCIVQNGESLSSLATRYNVNRLDILSYNDLDSESDIFEGQVLYIPRSVHK